MNIRNAEYKNAANTIIDVEIEHPEFGWLSYTFISEEMDESFDAEIRTWLESNTPADYVEEVITYTLKETKDLKITELQNSINYEEEVLVDGTYYIGGYESAQKLDSKRRLTIESNGTSVQYIDSEDNVITLTLEEAKNVCLAVANDYEVKFYYYKTKKKEINACKTVEALYELEL